MSAADEKIQVFDVTQHSTMSDIRRRLSLSSGQASDFAQFHHDDDDDARDDSMHLSPSEHAAALALSPRGSTAATGLSTLSPPSSVLQTRRHSKDIVGFEEIRSSLNRLHASTRPKLKDKLKRPETRTLTLKDSNMTAFLTEQVEAAYNELKKKEEDLRVAAELGQHLLDKVAEGVNHISELEEKIHEGRAVLDKNKEEKRVMERAEKRLRMQLEDLEQVNTELSQEVAKLKSIMDTMNTKQDGSPDDSQLERLKRDLMELQEKLDKAYADNARLSKSLHSEQGAHQDAINELAIRRKQAEDAAKREELLKKLQAEARNFAELKSKVDELERERRNMFKAVRDSEEEREYLRQALDERERVLKELQGGDPNAFSSPFGDTTTPNRNVKTRPARSPSLADDMNEAADEKPAEKSGGLVKRLLTALTGSGSSNGTAAAAAADPSAKESKNPLSPRGSQLFPPIKEGFSEDEEAGGHYGGQESGAYGGADSYSSPSVSASSSRQSLRGSASRESVNEHPLDGRELVKPPNAYDEHGNPYHDANKEFFYLTALSVKLNMGEMLDSVETVSTRQLYERAIAEKIPFHKYANWLEKQITHAYIERIYNKGYEESSNERSDRPMSPVARRTTVGTRGAPIRSSSSATDFRAAGAKISAKSPSYKPVLVPSRKKTVV